MKRVPALVLWKQIAWNEQCSWQEVLFSLLGVEKNNPVRSAARDTQLLEQTRLREKVPVRSCVTKTIIYLCWVSLVRMQVKRNVF